MNYYRIACKCVTPLFRIFFNYKIVGGENLLKAASIARVVVCTTHSSDLGGMIVGMAVSTILETEPWVVVNSKFRSNPLTNFFLKDMNIIWIIGNDMLGNYPALKKIADILRQDEHAVVIIAPQGIYNKPVPNGIAFRQGFALPCVQAVNTGAKVLLIPAIDVGATYRSFPAPGRRIAVALGASIPVTKKATRNTLTYVLENAVRRLMHDMCHPLP